MVLKTFTKQHIPNLFNPRFARFTLILAAKWPRRGRGRPEKKFCGQSRKWLIPTNVGHSGVHWRPLSDIGSTLRRPEEAQGRWT